MMEYEDLEQSWSRRHQSMPRGYSPTPSERRRQEDEDDVEAYYQIMISGQQDPAEEYASLIGNHPSSASYKYSAGSTPTRRRRAQSSETTPTRPSRIPRPKRKAELSPGEPEQPAPKMILPRPVVKQRYVSAGGNAKVNERAEIAAPIFTTAGSPPRALTTEEVNAKLKDTDWIVNTFGEAALEVANTLGDESPEVKKQRSSGKPKLMRRLFGRKNSQGED